MVFFKPITRIIFYFHLQPPKSVLAQVQLQPQVPIHTISFNCSDKEANEFLCQLAKDTQGRYHYYSESGVQSDGPEPWEVRSANVLDEKHLFYWDTF